MAVSFADVFQKPEEDWQILYAAIDRVQLNYTCREGSISQASIARRTAPPNGNRRLSAFIPLAEYGGFK